MDKLISVIIPVYNVAEYLPQCLETVCSQTYENLEIILVDDGSTDESGRLCDEWGEKDRRIKVIHKENGGVSSARNEGLKVATGEFIGFVDSDDWIALDMYEKLISSAICNQSDISMCGYFDYPYGSMDYPVQKGIQYHPPCNYEEAVIYIYERNGYFTSICNKLFSRDLIYRECGPALLNESIAVGEDELWLLHITKFIKRASFVPKPLYYYRVRGGSVTNFAKVSDRQLSVLEAKKTVLRFLPQTKAIQELARSVMYNDCFLMKVTAYCTDDKSAFSYISKELSPMRKYWLRSSDPPILRKAKVILMDLLMFLKAPKSLLYRLNQIKKVTIGAYKTV